MGGTCALQHRVRCLRQAPSRQARDGVGELRRLPSGAGVGRAPGPCQPGGAPAPRARCRARRSRGGRAAADAGDRGDLLRRLEAGRDAALDVGALRRRLDSPSPLGLGREAGGHGRGQRAALRRLGCADARPGGRHARGGLDRARCRRHLGRGSRAALLHVGNDRAREGDRACPPLHPRPRGVRLQPRGRRRRAVPRHGRMGVGGGDRAAPGPVAARRGAVRVPARGRLRSASSSSTSSAATR